MDTTSWGSLTNDEAAAVGAVLGGVLTATLVVYVLLVIALWRIFTKAGEKGWKSLIPVYNMVVAYRIVGMSPWWILASFVTALAYGIAVEAAMGGREFDWSKDELPEDVVKNGWVMITSLLASVISIYLAIRFMIRLAKAFKKGGWFAAGLVIFPTIFTLILGFGSAKYDKKILKA